MISLFNNVLHRLEERSTTLNEYEIANVSKKPWSFYSTNSGKILQKKKQEKRDNVKL